MSFTEETKVVPVNNAEILIKVLHLSNAVIVLITEQPTALGTICLATPSINIDGIRRGESLSLFGGRFDFFTQVIAERLSAETGKMTLVSVALNEKYQNDQDTLSKIINMIVEGQQPSSDGQSL